MKFPKGSLTPAAARLAAVAMAPTLTASTALAPPPTPTVSSAPLQPVTVLNLARDAESWASVSAELSAANLSYARLNASFDATTQTPTPTESRLVAALHNARCAGGGRCDPRGGVAGCAISHHRAWEAAYHADNATAPYGLFIEDDVLLQPGAGRAVAQALDEVAARQPGWAALWFTYAARDVGATSQGPWAPPYGGPDRGLWPLGDVARGAPAPAATAGPHFNTLVGSAAACYPGRAAGGHCAGAGGAADDPHCAADHPGARCWNFAGNTFYALSRRGLDRALRVVAREGLYEAADEVLLDACAGDCWLWSANVTRGLRKPAARSVLSAHPGVVLAASERGPDRLM